MKKSRKSVVEMLKLRIYLQLNNINADEKPVKRCKQERKHVYL